MSPSCSLRSSPNRRLVISELHLDTRFEIYGSTIGGTNFGMLRTPMPLLRCRNSRKNPHPQPPYQASAWSYRYVTIHASPNFPNLQFKSILTLNLPIKLSLVLLVMLFTDDLPSISANLPTLHYSSCLQQLELLCAL